MSNQDKKKNVVLNEVQRKLVFQIYHSKDGPGSLATPSNLYRAAHKQDQSISLSAVQHWWENQKNNIFTKKLAYSSFPRNVSLRYGYSNPSPMSSLSMDTMVLTNSMGKIMYYIFIAICDFSNYAFAFPAKVNTGRKAKEALEEFISPAENTNVKVDLKTIYTDEGSEYIAGVFNDYIKSLDAHHFYLKGQNKAFRAERFIRTYRSYLNRLRASHVGPLRYTDLRNVVASYNKNYSRAVGCSPYEARLPKNLNKVRAYKEKMRLNKYVRNYKTIQKVPKFSKGDYVLLRSRRGDVTFAKESDLRKNVNISRILFQIEEVVSDYPTQSYRLRNMHTGESFASKVPGNRLILAPEYYVKEKIEA